MELPLHHVGIAVPSIEAARPVFEALLGGRGTPTEPVPAQRVNVSFLGSGACALELLEPTDSDSPIARFLAKRGAGLHHLAYRVSDLDATLARLTASGVQLIDSAPRPGAGGHRVAFLHPRSCGGVLIELVEA